ncbi:MULTISPECIES: hypothetical protein [Kribbella]|uniref:hypothetical protein n=1 Tax=Kribbella TaxID=182639 RepID=UPI0013052BD0|nr:MULTISPECIES: hypothetical protein [Kribbella]
MTDGVQVRRPGVLVDADQEGPCVPHFSAIRLSKPCQVPLRTIFTTGFIGELVGIRTV